MKIVHIVRNIEYVGGTEKFLISLLESWHRKSKEDEIYLLCTEGVGPIAKNLSRRCKLKLINFPVVWWNPIDIFRLSGKLEGLNPDIVHTHLFQADFPGILAAKLINLKVISTKYCQFSRAIEKNTWPEKYFIKPLSDNLLERFLSLVTSRIIVVSQQATNHFLKKGYKSNVISVIPCCHITLKNKLFSVPIKRFNIDNLVKIGTVSRLVPEKGIDSLLNIFSDLYHKYDNLEFYIAGDGFLRENLKKKAKSLGIAKKVRFLGHINNIDGLLGKLDIFVFTSHSEGFPLAIQEAMAAGRTIVSTNVGGIKELIKNKENGILFTDGNNNEATHYLKYLLENPDYAKKLAINARKAMKSTYNLDQVINSIHRVYSNLLKI